MMDPTTIAQCVLVIVATYILYPLFRREKPVPEKPFAPLTVTDLWLHEHRGQVFLIEQAMLTGVVEWDDLWDESVKLTRKSGLEFRWRRN